ncbi:helix-turn-helix domain-containing protein [Algivirga pacifica]|uniref:Helix-turn-helix domain-containing protein n=1 Tax=Algivirga pacifica TaxID=1162670 RepID=A0ABP9D112_9BACT
MKQTMTIEMTPGDLEQLLENAINKALNRARNEKLTQSDEELLSIREVADYLSVTEVTIHNWKRAGKLKYKKIGNRVFFSKREIEKLVS